MLLAPVALAVAAADAAAVAALAVAALPAARVVRGWEEGATREQLRRERDAERVSLLLRAAVPSILLASVLLVLAIAHLLPPLVPGAMCGTGVLEAAAGLGERALFTRLLAAAALWALVAVDGVDRKEELSRLAPVVAKGALLVLPLAALAASDTARLLFGLDVVRPVDCCAAAVATVGPVGGPAVCLFLATEPARLWALVASALGLAALAPRVRSAAGAAALAACAVVFVPIAVSALLEDLVPYHYGLLAHRCPWCLFLPAHRLAGWPLFGALAVVAFEAAAALAVASAGGGEAGRRRLRSSGRRIAAAAVAFCVGASAPALVWRLRFGVFL